MAKGPVNEQGVEFTNAIARAMRDGALKGEDYAKFRAVISDPSVDPWIRQELAQADAFRYGMPYKDPTKGYAPGDDLTLGGTGESSADTVNRYNGQKLQDALNNQPPGGWNGHGSNNPPDSPGYVPPGGGGDPFVGGTNSNFGQGGGGVRGPAGTNWGAIDAALRPPLTGWEASTNKDFYQKQFQDLRTDENAAKLRQLAAAIRAQEAQNNPPAPTDPWAWANLPEVKMGTGQPTTSAPDWQLNPRFGWGQGTTNQQILQDVNPLLSDSEQQYLKKNPNALENAPSFLNQQAFFDWTNTSHPNDKGWGSVINKLYNNVWQDIGSQASGPMVPVGYAAPV